MSSRTARATQRNPVCLKKKKKKPTTKKKDEDFDEVPTFHVGLIWGALLSREDEEHELCPVHLENRKLFGNTRRKLE